MIRKFIPVMSSVSAVFLPGILMVSPHVSQEALEQRVRAALSWANSASVPCLVTSAELRVSAIPESAIIYQPVAGLWERSAAPEAKPPGPKTNPLRPSPVTSKQSAAAKAFATSKKETGQAPDLEADSVREYDETQDVQSLVNPEEQLSQYAETISSLVNSRKEYPYPARQQKQQGMVQVRFVLSREGRFAQEPVVEQKCPYEHLNVAALDAVKNAAPYPPFPDGIEEAELGFSIMITFSLK